MYGDGLRIVFEELSMDDPKIQRRDISRAKDVLGWR